MNGPVVIACPNLSLDRTMLVDRVSTGAVHRSSRTDVRGGGKGVNVARALARMGVRDTLVAGFAAGHTGDAVLGLLRDEGIETLATPGPGETRSCLSVVAAGSVTVFNEEGPPVDQDRWRAYEESLLAMLLSDSVFVCSGSFPPGAPAEGVARLLSAAREAGCATVCDTSREHLAAALGSRPDLIKPNLPEAEALLEARFRESGDPGGDAGTRALRAARALIASGPRAVVVSAGSAGAALVDSEREMTWGPAPVKVINPIGAGDCLVAGYVLGLCRGLPRSEAVALGLAMASASCETFYAGDLQAERAHELLDTYFAQPGRSDT